jgi:hypothetical protein
VLYNLFTTGWKVAAGGEGFEPSERGLARSPDYKSGGLNRAHPSPHVEARGRAPLTVEFCRPPWHYAAPASKNGDEGSHACDSFSSPFPFLIDSFKNQRPSLWTKIEFVSSVLWAEDQAIPIFSATSLIEKPRTTSVASKSFTARRFSPLRRLGFGFSPNGSSSSVLTVSSLDFHVRSRSCLCLMSILSLSRCSSRRFKDSSKSIIVPKSSTNSFSRDWALSAIDMVPPPTIKPQNVARYKRGLPKSHYFSECDFVKIVLKARWQP